MKSFLPKGLILPLLIIWACFDAFSQQDSYDLLFKSATVSPSANASEFIQSPEIFAPSIFQGKYYLLLQFNEIPSPGEQARIQNLGINLMHYMPHAAYHAAVPMGISPSDWQTLNLRAVMPVQAHWKLGDWLADNLFPDWALQEDDHVDVFVQYQQDLEAQFIRQAIGELPYARLIGESNAASYLSVRVKNNRYYELAAHPWVSYVEVIPAPAEPEDKRGRSLQRANVINTDFPTGRHYDGTGVSILVRDDGLVGPHIDFQGRLNNLTTDATGTHGDGVGGIMGGAGNLDPYYRGMASGSEVYVINYQANFLDNTLSLHQNDDVMITNSSYSNGCNAGYTSITQTVDQQIRLNPSLMHVFSAGNSNNSDCGYGAGNQWGNITGGHKQGKNVITTANLFADDVLVGSSSRGPAHDGRIKPDLAAHGQGQGSTNPNNAYQSFGGTSAAAPSLAGTLATLYEAYKTLNAGVNPESPLMKAILMNTADDLGNPGPDYRFGWGRINALRAIKILENNQYLTSNISQGGVNSHTLVVPTGVSEMRVMIYWMDREAAVNAAPALVNDIDMRVAAPGGATFNPWILNPAPNVTTLNLPATRGFDHLNNMEQVTIDNPTAGSYNLRIDATTVPFGPVKYYIVYEYVTEEITVTYPIGGEGFVPSESERLHWDAFGTVGNFTLEYSTNNGSTWNLISNTVSGAARLFDWNIPNSVTGEALVRVTRGANSDVSDAPFTIIDDPNTLTVNNLCIGGVTVSWAAVPGAIEYEVFMLGNKYMDVIGRTPITSFNVYGLTNGDTYWFSVRAILGPGEYGRRAIAVEHVPNGSGVCSIDDLTMGSITAPVSLGRSCVSGGFSATEQVSVLIQNTGISNLTSPTFFYQVNGGTIVSEVYPGTINSGDTYTFNFTTTANLSTGSFHTLKTWVTHPVDLNLSNDTLTSTVQSIDNLPITLPFLEDFESALPATYQNTLEGLTGLTRADFQTNVSGLGRLRTDPGAGYHNNGSRSVTMDVSSDGNYAINNLILTFNLTNYLATPDLLMNFSFMHHGEESDPNDRVWVRGSTADGWVEIYDWVANLPPGGTFVTVQGLDVSTVLANAGQSVGCTFQVRFGQEDNFTTATPGSTDGLTIDDVQLYRRGLEMVSIIDPIGSSGCAILSANEDVTVRVLNDRASMVTNLGVFYRINNGVPIMETIPTIAGGATVDYTFTQQANLSGAGTYDLDVWMASVDDFPADDSIMNAMVVSGQSQVAITLPLVEDFELATAATVQANTQGVAGLSYLSFETSLPTLGRLRTDVGAGFPSSGQRALTLDVSTDNNFAVNYAILTYNLGNYQGTNDLLMDFSYMHHSEESHPNDRVWVRDGTSSPWIEIYDWYANRAGAGIYSNVVGLDVSGVLTAAGQAIGCGFQIRFGQEDNFTATALGNTDGLTFDDVVLYLKGLEVAQVTAPVSSVNCVSLSRTEDITVRIINQSSSAFNNVDVFYQVNGGTVVQDLIPAIPGNSFLDHTFATQANLNAVGTYDIDIWIGQVDDFTTNDTIRNYSVFSQDVIQTFPFLETFETGPAGWQVAGTNPTWAWGTPAGTMISKAASGRGAWVTNLSGTHGSNELGYLISPCFDLSGFATDPILSFSLIHELEDTYDFGWIEYSEDGTTWTKLGVIGNGFNWYGYTGNVWNGELNRQEWRLASYTLPASAMTNSSTVRLRWVFDSDGSATFEGLGIDDIHIHADESVFAGASTTTLSQNVSGNQWVDFQVGNNKVVSINPRGQNLGNTSVDVFVNATGAVRDFGNKYYHDRNLVVNTANRVGSPVGVRFYYLDTEVWDLYNATTCATCAGIPDLYTLGISKYDGANEDGDLANSTDPGFLYIPAPNTSIVPYNNGYWVEFDVTGFSELWINPGGALGNTLPFPIEWLAFEAKAIDNDAQLTWATASENNNHGFFVEHAWVSDNGMTPVFSDRGFVQGNGTTSQVSNYNFRVNDLQYGTHLFRLRQVDVNGKDRHSETRELTYMGTSGIQVYPNPFSENLTVEVTSEYTQSVSVMIIDPTGREIYSQKKVMQAGRELIDISIGKNLPEGLYLVRVMTLDGAKVVKVMK